MFVRGVVLLLCASLSSTMRVLTWPHQSCSRQGLTCTVKTGNCLDKSWLKVYSYTPSKPENLQASVDIRRDEAGHLMPVLNASWRLQDDGSIRELKATEIHVLVMSTNENFCVRYSFKRSLPMRSPSREKWSFSASMVVLEPGQMYRVSAVNIPKPAMDHSSYDVSQEVTVPDCQDSTMRMTQFCIERGSLWQANVRLAKVGVGERSQLAVSFSPDPLGEEYVVVVGCATFRQHVDGVYTGNHTTLNVTFSLEKWPRSCCQFYVQVKPLFPKCGQDCTRRERTLDICRVHPTKATTPGTQNVPFHTCVTLGAVIICVVTVNLWFFCRKPRKLAAAAAAPAQGPKPPQLDLKQPPKVLVIYSHDHYLYRNVVLNLCNFLQDKCGTEVLVDLMDSTSVGVMGRVRWLEWQRQQLSHPFDKILVLCSPGVQAKWRALCGQGRVTLREDLRSPTDDMVTPFFHLFLPDMHQAGRLGKYMVAYFDDICGEADVPSVFDFTIKYKLMKHFEELYFRMVDVEKYQPHHVNHIKGIGGDEYSGCRSGKGLKAAIETFRAYQSDNPDWFEKECVDGEAQEEEDMTEAELQIRRLQIPPALECVPLIREGPPIRICDVEAGENSDGVYVLTPELNPLLSAVELTPIVNPEYKHQYPSHPDDMPPRGPGPASVYIAQPVLNQAPPPRLNRPPGEEPRGRVPYEDAEEGSPPPASRLSAPSERGSSAPQNSPRAISPESSLANGPGKRFPPSEARVSRLPAESEDGEVLEPSAKATNSGSDQGYISKDPSRHELADEEEEDPLAALARLQEELFLQDMVCSGMELEGH